MKTRLKMGGYQGDGSVHTKGLRAFIDALGPTADEFDIDLCINVTAVGGTATGLFAGIRDGSFDVCYMASGYLSAEVPSLDLLDVPFSIIDRERAYASLDGSVGEALRHDVRAKTGLEVLAYWDNGFRHVTNRKHAVRSPADSDKMSLRTLNNESYMEVLRLIGFEPMFTDVANLVPMVEAGEVDAQENPLTNTVNFGIHKYHRYVSLTSHIFGLALFVANGEWLKGLTAAQREAVTRATRAATRVQRQASIDDDVRLLKLLRDDGVEVLTAEQIDMAAFRAAGAPCAERLRNGLPADLCADYLQS